MKVQDLIQEMEDLDTQYSLVLARNTSFSGKKALVVKDNICTQGIITTAGSKILEKYIPVFDATVIARAKKQGFDVLCKNPMDEFGFGSFGTHCAFKIPKNPHDTHRVCGGSSAGTAAYIASSKYVDYGLGQSTGGSIACPASFCGVVGLTPTYGLVSRYGAIDYGNSLDKIGPITKTVKQSAELLSFIAGKDEKDGTTYAAHTDNYPSFCGKSIKGLKIGVPREYFGDDVDEEVKESVRSALDVLKKKGAILKDISLPLQNLVVPVYYILANAEASTNLAKYCGLRYGLQKDIRDFDSFDSYASSVRSSGFGLEAKRRIMIGTFVRMLGYRDAFYLKALRLREKLIYEYQKIFQDVDVIAGPSMPILPPTFTEAEALSPVQAYLVDIFTIPSNLCGFPSLSVPCCKKGLPVGLQLIGNHFKEGLLFQIGDAYENNHRS